MGRWLLVVTLLLAAIIVAFSIFVVTGVIDGPALFWRVGTQVGWLRPHLETYAHGQDAEAWIARQEEALQLRVEELELRVQELQSDQKRLEQWAQQLDKREADLNALEAKLQAEQAQRRNTQTLAQIYTSMDPEEAAQILAQLDQDLILAVLLQMDLQLAADILTNLPTNLAVTLSKQIGQAQD